MEVGLADVGSVVVKAGVLVLVKRTPWARAPGAARAPSKASEKRMLKLLLKRQLSESGKGTKDV